MRSNRTLEKVSWDIYGTGIFTNNKWHVVKNKNKHLKSSLIHVIPAAIYNHKEKKTINMLRMVKQKDENPKSLTTLLSYSI